MVQVIGVGLVGGDDPANPGITTESVHLAATQLSMPDLGEWRDALYARIVERVGDRRYMEHWAEDISRIAAAQRDTDPGPARSPQAEPCRRRPLRRVPDRSQLYKAELVHRRGPWRGLEDLELATLRVGRLVQSPPARPGHGPATGRRHTVWALIVVWRYSRHCFVWSTTSQQLGAVVEGLEAAWACFRGVSRYLVIDNFPAAVAVADALHPRLGGAG